MLLTEWPKAAASHSMVQGLFTLGSGGLGSAARGVLVMPPAPVPQSAHTGRMGIPHMHCGVRRHGSLRALFVQHPCPSGLRMTCSGVIRHCRLCLAARAHSAPILRNRGPASQRGVAVWRGGSLPSSSVPPPNATGGGACLDGWTAYAAIAGALRQQGALRPPLDPNPFDMSGRARRKGPADAEAAAHKEPVASTPERARGSSDGHPAGKPMQRERGERNQATVCRITA